MTFKELANRRESCRDYSTRAVSEELLCDVLETACLSPSACNSQPWKFIAVQGARAEALRPLVQVGGRNGFTANVSTFVAVCETNAVLRPGVRDDQQHFAQMDLGMATVMLTLAACDVGLSTCILGCFDEDAVKKLLGVPEAYPVRLIVAMGYAREEGTRKKIRKPGEETVAFDRW